MNSDNFSQSHDFISPVDISLTTIFQNFILSNGSGGSKLDIEGIELLLGKNNVSHQKIGDSSFSELRISIGHETFKTYLFEGNTITGVPFDREIESIDVEKGIITFGDDESWSGSESFYFQLIFSGGRASLIGENGIYKGIDGKSYNFDGGVEGNNGLAFSDKGFFIGMSAVFIKGLESLPEIEEFGETNQNPLAGNRYVKFKHYDEKFILEIEDGKANLFQQNGFICDENGYAYSFKEGSFIRSQKYIFMFGELLDLNTFLKTSDEISIIMSLSQVNLESMYTHLPGRIRFENKYLNTGYISLEFSKGISTSFSFNKNGIIHHEFDLLPNWSGDTNFSGIVNGLIQQVDFDYDSDGIISQKGLPEYIASNGKKHNDNFRIMFSRSYVDLSSELQDGKRKIIFRGNYFLDNKRKVILWDEENEEFKEQKSMYFDGKKMVKLENFPFEYQYSSSPGEIVGDTFIYGEGEKEVRLQLEESDEKNEDENIVNKRLKTMHYEPSGRMGSPDYVGEDGKLYNFIGTENEGEENEKIRNEFVLVTESLIIGGELFDINLSNVPNYGLQDIDIEKQLIYFNNGITLKFIIGEHKILPQSVSIKGTEYFVGPEKCYKLFGGELIDVLDNMLLEKIFSQSNPVNKIQSGTVDGVKQTLK